MGWTTDDGTHEGYVGAVLPDGQVASTYSDGTVLLWNDTTDAFDSYPEDDVVAWVTTCSCNWSGEWWTRVHTPALHDLDGRRVHAPGGFAPEQVEDAGYVEWREHLAPVLARQQVAEAAGELAAARDRLDAAVAQARAAGVPWADIGNATGMTRQSAHERWAPTS